MVNPEQTYSNHYQSVPRAVMVAVGASLLIVYVAAAVVVYELLIVLARSPPDLATALVMIGTITVLAAYLILPAVRS